MLERKIKDDLLSWKKSKNKMSLVIKGARQTGKTYAIDRFGKAEYPNYIYMNFEENPTLKVIFDDDLNVENLIKRISIRFPKAKFIKGKTLLFLDEIQSCPNARVALKFLTMDERIDVIASGSLLGIEYGEVSSFPVGYTEQVTMHGLDFEEFLWANGVSPAQINDLKKNLTSLKPVDEFLHEEVMGLFKEYMVTGGMPACVKVFVETKNFAQVLKVQKAIISDYLDDIAKYAKHSEKAKARECFLSMPRQLAKEYKKFQYGVVEKKGTARKFEGSVRWLIDAGIAVPCYNLSTLELPLEGNKITDEFKMYVNDTGLLVAMLDEGTGADIIDGNLGIYKGAIFENIVADIFTKQDKKLYYYAKPSRFEIDFINRQGKNLLPIEVKSSENTKAKSLKLIVSKHKIKKAIKLSTKNLGERDGIISVPLYMVMFL